MQPHLWHRGNVPCTFDLAFFSSRLFVSFVALRLSDKVLCHIYIRYSAHVHSSFYRGFCTVDFRTRIIYLSISLSLLLVILCRNLYIYIYSRVLHHRTIRDRGGCQILNFVGSWVPRLYLAYNCTLTQENYTNM